MKLLFGSFKNFAAVVGLLNALAMFLTIWIFRLFPRQFYELNPLSAPFFSVGAFGLVAFYTGFAFHMALVLGAWLVFKVVFERLHTPEAMRFLEMGIVIAVGADAFWDIAMFLIASFH